MPGPPSLRTQTPPPPLPCPSHRARGGHTRSPPRNPLRQKENRTWAMMSLALVFSRHGTRAFQNRGIWTVRKVFKWGKHETPFEKRAPAQQETEASRGQSGRPRRRRVAESRRIGQSVVRSLGGEGTDLSEAVLWHCWGSGWQYWV